MLARDDDASPKRGKDAIFPQNGQSAGFKLKNHNQIIEMLENFERVAPQALNIFIENAKK